LREFCDIKKQARHTPAIEETPITKKNYNSENSFEKNLEEAEVESRHLIDSLCKEALESYKNISSAQSAEIYKLEVELLK
jgi:hypothetical protein